jgi:hypothetical protein
MDRIEVLPEPDLPINKTFFFIAILQKEMLGTQNLKSSYKEQSKRAKTSVFLENVFNLIFTVKNKERTFWNLMWLLYHFSSHLTDKISVNKKQGGSTKKRHLSTKKSFKF